jgi:hypothetical protein
MRLGAVHVMKFDDVGMGELPQYFYFVIEHFKA